jgi:hypothetical protein
MIEGQPIACKANKNPPGYRIIFQDVEIGSISQQTRRTDGGRVFWRWAVDAMPLLDITAATRRAAMCGRLTLP